MAPVDCRLYLVTDRHQTAGRPLLSVLGRAVRSGVRAIQLRERDLPIPPMLKGKTIAVVVPCYNEETQIATVVETMPDYVDRIVIVNDCSPDRTAEVVKDLIAKDRAKGVGTRIERYKVERTR